MLTNHKLLEATRNNVRPSWQLNLRGKKLVKPRGITTER